MPVNFFDELPWLKRPPPPFFRRPGISSGKSRVTKEYNIHRQNETWAFTVTMELLARGGGRVQLRSYQGPIIGRASFSDLNEGTRLFNELWEEAQDQTMKIEEEL